VDVSGNTTFNSPHFFPHDRIADRAGLAQLALSCESLAPRVGLEPVDHPESIFLDVTGVAHLFGGEAGLVEQVRRHFQRRGYTARLGLADTIGAAWGLARFGEARSDFDQLPLEALRLSPATNETLRQLGLIDYADRPAIGLEPNGAPRFTVDFHDHHPDDDMRRMSKPIE
jgi:protein ImuB